MFTRMLRNKKNSKYSNQLYLNAEQRFKTNIPDKEEFLVNVYRVRLIDKASKFPIK